MLPEGALSPNNCGEHARGKDGTVVERGKGCSYVCVFPSL